MQQRIRHPFEHQWYRRREQSTTASPAVSAPIANKTAPVHPS